MKMDNGKKTKTVVKSAGKVKNVKAGGRGLPQNPAKAAAAIKFGTDGFRGVIARDFTFEAVETVVRAICDYIHSKKLTRRVAVFYDRRFLSDLFAAHAAGIFSRYAVGAALSEGPVPTPALSYYVKNAPVALGVMITASHNPYEYNGIKIKTTEGTSAPGELIAEVQKRVDAIAREGFDEKKFMKAHSIAGSALNEKISVTDDYLRNIAVSLDMRALKKLGGLYLINPMFGSQAGNFKRFADAFGLAARSEEIFGAHNPLFPGFNPEPIAPNLAEMSALMKKRRGADKFAAGFCFDGDGDRIGAMTSGGVFVSPQIIFALLLRHLVKNKKRRGAVAKTVSVTALVSRIAEKHGLELYETPIGFKYIAELMLDGTKRVMIGGEESGGIGLQGYLPERDGLFLALCLMEMMAFEKKTLDELVESLFAEYGRYVYDRVDFRVDAARFDAIKEKLAGERLSNVCGLGVSGYNAADGHKYFLRDGSWLLFRFSGTEPVLRIYAEAPVRARGDEKKAGAMLEFAKKHLGI